MGTPLDPELCKELRADEPAKGWFDAWGPRALPHAPGPTNHPLLLGSKHVGQVLLNSGPPSATQSCPGHPWQQPGALIVQPSSNPKAQASDQTGTSLFLTSPAHSPRPSPLTQAYP